MTRRVKVFISSTSKDLKQDCRRRTIETIQLTQDVEPVAMERWISEYGHTAAMCLKKLKESTHFLGIFAYRYGWRPDGPGTPSITQKEFIRALELGRPMFILVPQPGTDFDLELRKRADDQSAEDREAQKAFILEVTQKVCCLFEDLADMVIRVTHIIRDWQEKEKHGKLRSRARNRTPASKSVTAPSRSALMSLGRDEQEELFDKCLRKKVILTTPEAACFLVHGQFGYGHEELLARLQNKLSEGQEVFPIAVDVSPAWRGRDLPALLEAIGNQIDEKLDTVERLAERLKKEMTTLDVVLRFDNLQRLYGSLADFADEFWQPLAKSLNGADVSKRVTCLASFKGSLDQTSGQHLYGADSQEPFESARIIVLPELAQFTENDLLVWLVQQKMTKDKAKNVAATLFQETQGDPAKLFNELTSVTNWNH